MPIENTIDMRIIPISMGVIMVALFIMIIVIVITHAEYLTGTTYPAL